MKKFKKFTAVAGAAAIMGAGALTAPTAFAQEEGSASTVTESSQGENGEGDVSSDVETSSNELSSDLGSSEGEGEGAEGDASSEFRPPAMSSPPTSLAPPKSPLKVKRAKAPPRKSRLCLA